MRKITALLFLLLVPLVGMHLPGDVDYYLNKGILHMTPSVKGWEAASRAPLDLVDYAIERTYGRRPAHIYPLEGKDHLLVAYAIDLEDARVGRGERHGIPPASAVVISAYLTEEPFLAELHGPRFSAAMPCRNPEALVLTRRLALVARCSNEWRAVPAGRKTPTWWIDQERQSPPENISRVVSALHPTWDAFVRGKLASSQKVLFEEFDEVYPISFAKTWGIRGVPHRQHPDHEWYGYWFYSNIVIETVGVMASAAYLRWREQRYDFGSAFLIDRDDPFLGPVQAYLCSYWIPLGVYMVDEQEREIGLGCGNANDGSPGVISSFPRTPVPRPFWEFAKRNQWFWENHRLYNRGYDVVVPFLSKFGRYVNENHLKPPDVTEVGRKKSRDAWWRYLKERLLRGGIMIPSALSFPVMGIDGIVSPGYTVAGWDDGKRLIAVYSPLGIFIKWSPNGGTSPNNGGSIYEFPGYVFVAPEYAGDWPAWLYPPRPLENMPPAVAFPTRALVNEGDEVEFVADAHWDREGEKITWRVEESPFPVVEKGPWSFKIQVDQPEGNYVIWVAYSDGGRSVHHPIVIHVFPTYRFAEE